ncbi:MAG: small subunit ribosomal protein S17 [Verrucomicrobiales bacterium]|jgi:small subunit ribosomal protein S17
MSDQESNEAPAEAAATAPAAAAATSSESSTGSERALRKSRVGVVISDNMEKTIVVSVTRRVPHPKFKKIIKRSTKFYAHDEKGEAKLGDKVRIVEGRPMSKLKRWRLEEVLAH